MVSYVTLATSMGKGGMAIGGVTCVTRNIYGWGGACQDMQSDVHCLRFSAVPDAVGYAMQVSMKGMAIKGNTALSHRASKCFPAISRAREPAGGTPNKPPPYMYTDAA